MGTFFRFFRAFGLGFSISLGLVYYIVRARAVLEVGAGITKYVVRIYVASGGTLKGGDRECFGVALLFHCKKLWCTNKIKLLIFCVIARVVSRVEKLVVYRVLPTSERSMGVVIRRTQGPVQENG